MRGSLKWGGARGTQVPAHGTGYGLKPWRLGSSATQINSKRLRAGAWIGALLAALALATTVTMTGCGVPGGTQKTPITTATKDRGPALYWLLDANAAAAKSATELRFSVVALDPRDGHVAWRHELETPRPDMFDGALRPPLLLNGLVYAGYYYFDLPTMLHHAVLETLDPATGRTRWRHEVAGGSESELVGEPVVDGTTVYLSSEVFQTQGEGQPPVESGLVEALDGKTGAVRWRKALDFVPTMPAVQDGRVFVMASGQSAGHLLALSASDGSVLWDNRAVGQLARGGDTDNGETTAPVVAGSLVYASAVERDPDGSADMVVTAFNMSDGSVAWRYDTGGIAATPALNQSGDTLCVSAFAPSAAGSTSAVAGLAAATGEKRWSVAVAGIASACTAAGDTFYLTEAPTSYTTGSVVALSSRDGRQAWAASTGAPVIADGALPPAVDGVLAVVYLQAPPPASGPVTSTMEALRTSDGKPVWRVEVSSRPEKPAEIAGGQIYVPDIEGDLPGLAAYSLATGARLWSYRLGNG